MTISSSERREGRRQARLSNKRRAAKSMNPWDASRKQHRTEKVTDLRYLVMKLKDDLGHGMLDFGITQG